MWFALLALATLAQEPTCAPPDDAPPGTLSVAWVSPVRRRVGSHHWLNVTPTTELRRWLAQQPDPNLGDLLHHVGQRRTTKEPSRRYKVTIFEVPGEALCASELEAPSATYRAQWSALARRGFCLLPAERFVTEGR